jgi:hypothetical protein
VTGGPIIPLTPPKLVPLPQLVPIDQQNQVNPLNEITGQGSPIKPVGAIKIEYIDENEHQHNHPHEDCCICLEPLVSPGKQNKCGHAVCADCTKHLHKAECPLCRARLEGGYLTEDIGKAIADVENTDAYVAGLIRRAKGEYSARYPDRVFANDRLLPVEAESFGEAFGEFAEANPGMSVYDGDRVISAFFDFMVDERRNRPTLSFQDGIAEFTIIGLEMLGNQNLTFDNAYNMFFRTLH